MKLLPNINGHDDLVLLSESDKKLLCEEIREFLISSVSSTGGHLAGNLGVVELTVAMETVYDTRKDRIVFDVGHQSYVHKILTGRRDAFSGLRQYGGISGFPRPQESECDAFVAGHASSSVSIALGMARARTLLHEDYQVAALIGDGATTGGMAYEGMNNAADSREPMVIILNDNEMSIGKNVGGISRHLSKLRSSENYLDTKRWYRQTMHKIPGGKQLYQVSSQAKNRLKRFLLQPTVFENMGLTYLGPVDGHDLTALISVLRVAKEMQEPVLVHVVTKKGYGYLPAEEDPARFHGIGKFDPKTGESTSKSAVTFSDAFGQTMVGLGGIEPRVCGITAAMPAGTGLTDFAKQYPKRFFDVGIAEEHAVSMAGGLAKQGMIPVVALYSTFLQRAFDQIIQDVAMLRLHVVLAIDRAGLVGEDGPTHHGVFDVGFLRQIPGMVVLAPASLAELKAMVHWSVMKYDGPVSVRYPRGTEGAYSECEWDQESEYGLQKRISVHKAGSKVVLITYGTLINNIMTAAERLEQDGIHPTILRLLNLSDCGYAYISQYIHDGDTVITIEEAARFSGLSDYIGKMLLENKPCCRYCRIDLGSDFIPHGSQSMLYRDYRLDADSVAAYVKEVLRSEK